jgi:hypothetical protein
MQVFFPLRGLEDKLLKLQDAVDAGFRKLFSLVPILDGKLLDNVVVTTTPVEVPHGLGRRPRGWLVVKSNVSVIVYQASESAYPELNLRLTASGTDVVSIWVF